MDRDEGARAPAQDRCSFSRAACWRDDAGALITEGDRYPRHVESSSVRPILEVREISRHFSGNLAVESLSLDLRGGQVIGLIGPNGSGKTTVLNVICGYYPPNSGDVLLLGKSLRNRPPYRIAEAGVGRSFQVPRLFPDLTVDEHLSLARTSGIAARGSRDLGPRAHRRAGGDRAVP